MTFLPNVSYLKGMFTNLKIIDVSLLEFTPCFSHNLAEKIMINRYDRPIFSAFLDLCQNLLYLPHLLFPTTLIIKAQTLNRFPNFMCLRALLAWFGGKSR